MRKKNEKENESRWKELKEANLDADSSSGCTGSPFSSLLQHSGGTLETLISVYSTVSWNMYYLSALNNSLSLDFDFNP